MLLKRLLGVLVLPIFLSSCYAPPFNNFEPYTHISKPGMSHSGVGLYSIPGRGIYKGTRARLKAELTNKYDIQIVEYGDTITLIIPTDRYYFFNSARFNQLCYAGLARIIKFIYFYPESTFYVAAFTDDVGSKRHKEKLTQARAETMLTFLWANGINAKHLNAEGYGSKYPIGDNRLIHGSAHNRRIEIQWFKNPIRKSSFFYFGRTK